MSIQSVNLEPKVKKGGGLLGKILGGVLGTVAGVVTGVLTAGTAAGPAAAGGASAGEALAGALGGAATGAGTGSAIGGLAGEAISPSEVKERTGPTPLERRANIDPEVGIARLQEASKAVDATPEIPASEATATRTAFASAMDRLRAAKEAQTRLGAPPDWRAEDEMRRRHGVITN